MNTFSHLRQYVAEIFLEIFQINVMEKIVAYILCSVTLFYQNRAVYEITSKHVVGPEKPQTIWRIRVEC